MLKIDNDKLCFNSVTDEEKKCTNKENNARGVCKFVSETELMLKIKKLKLHYFKMKN